MPRFETDYLILDEFGTKEILCMGCGVPVKSRMEIRSDKFNGHVIRELSKHTTYREIPVIRDDNSITFVMVCNECAQKEITDEESDKITEQIKAAFKKQLLWEGKEEELIDYLISDRFPKVMRQAEVQEVTKALRSK